MSIGKFFNKSQTNDGRTPLHIAISTKNSEIVFLLVQNGFSELNLGSKKDAVDFMNRTPLHYSFII